MSLTNASTSSGERRTPSSSARSMLAITEPSGSRSSRPRIGVIVSVASALARSAISCFAGSPSKFARPTQNLSNQRESVSTGTSSSPRTLRRVRTDIGSAYSETS